ncbi:MAG: hypothetical protein L3J11_10620 [Draconibacterium sp.]|nr:hypothetical protein [Draconibacterium sp.]
MKKHSTLIYLVNSFRAESTQNNVDDAFENSLTATKFEPSGYSIKNILDFARSYEVLITESTGHVEMILN